MVSCVFSYNVIKFNYLLQKLHSNNLRDASFVRYLMLMQLFHGKGSMLLTSFWRISDSIT